MTVSTEGLNLHLRLDQIAPIADAGPGPVPPPVPDDSSSLVVPPISLYSEPAPQAGEVPVPVVTPAVPAPAEIPPDVSTAPVPPPSGNGQQPPPAPATQPTVVPDEIFGGSLSFDGGSDAGIALDPAVVPHGNTMTLALWANGADVLPTNSAIFEALDSNRLRSVNVHLPYGDGVVYFDCGNDGVNYDRVQKQAQPEEYKGSWAHWAFTKDAVAGTMTIYRNGLVWASTTGATRPIPVSRAAALGTTLDDPVNGRWAGKVANLRLYDRVLSPDEVRAVIAEDQAALATFRQSFPIDVGIYDDASDQPVLSITNDSIGRTLRVEVTDSADRTLRFLPGSAGPVTADNYHLLLRFRPGTLSPSFLAGASSSLATLADGWTGTAVTEPDGLQSIYLLATAPPTLDPGLQLAVRLPGVSADGTGGARGTRVQVSYRNLAWSGDDTTPVEGSRTVHLDVLNTAGGGGGGGGLATRLPLHVGFTGSRSVLNDGSANSLDLTVTNARLSDSLVLNPPTASAPTRFLLTFDASPGRGAPSRDWALATADQILGIAPSVPANPGAWSVVLEPADSPQWAIAPAGAVTLAPGESFTIHLAPIVTTLPDGEANAYLTYENLPGFPDTQVVLPIQKTRVVIQNGAIGLGRTPRSGLDLGTAAVTGTVIDVAQAKQTLWSQGQLGWNADDPFPPGDGRFAWGVFAVFGSKATFPDGQVLIPLPSSQAVTTSTGEQRFVGGTRSFGLLLRAAEALYCELTPGATYLPPSAFHIISFAPNAPSAPVPSNYLLLAFVSTDRTLHVATGQVLPLVIPPPIAR
jgi:hypothetical protein